MAYSSYIISKGDSNKKVSLINAKTAVEGGE